MPKYSARSKILLDDFLVFEVTILARLSLFPAHQRRENRKFSWKSLVVNRNILFF